MKRKRNPYTLDGKLRPGASTLVDGRLMNWSPAGDHATPEGVRNAAERMAEIYREINPGARVEIVYRNREGDDVATAELALAP